MAPDSSPNEPCPHCDGGGWLVDGTFAGFCSCRGQLDLESRLERAGVPLRYRGCRLDNFRTAAATPASRPELVRARAECRRYVETFVELDGAFRTAGLLFVGPPGVGKTHLAVAVLVELMQSYQIRGRFVDFTSLINEIQATFDRDTPRSKGEIIDPVRHADLLVLDELGAQKPTPWVSDLLYLIINGRYSDRLPTLFTTNYRLESPDSPGGANSPPSGELTTARVQLSQRVPPMITSRLYEMAKPIELTGADDYRRVVQMHQHRV